MNEIFNGEPWPMREACKRCDFLGEGTIKTSPGGQDIVRCGNCDTYVYAAPRDETGRAVRSLRTRPDIKPSQKARILERDNGTCVLCHRSDLPLSVGHLISVEYGRKTDLTEDELYHDENLAAMCDECNAGQSARPLSLRFCIALLRARLTYLKERPGP